MATTCLSRATESFPNGGVEKLDWATSAHTQAHTLTLSCLCLCCTNNRTWAECVVWRCSNTTVFCDRNQWRWMCLGSLSSASSYRPSSVTSLWPLFPQIHTHTHSIEAYYCVCVCLVCTSQSPPTEHTYELTHNEPGVFPPSPKPHLAVIPPQGSISHVPWLPWQRGLHNWRPKRQSMMGKSKLCEKEYEHINNINTQ